MTRAKAFILLDIVAGKPEEVAQMLRDKPCVIILLPVKDQLSSNVN